MQIGYFTKTGENLIIRRLRLIIVAVLSILFTVYANVQTRQEPTAGNIVKLAAELGVKNDELKKRSVSFIKTFELHELDRDSNFKAIRDKKITYHGNAYPPSINSEDKGLDIDLNLILTRAYYYDFIEASELAGVMVDWKYCPSCYVIKFKPRENIDHTLEEIVPPDSGAKKIAIYATAVRLEGILYIDKNGLYLKKMDATLPKEFSQHYVITVNKVGLTVEQEKRPDFGGIIVVKYINLFSQYKAGLWIFSSYTTERRIWTYTDYSHTPIK